MTDQLGAYTTPLYTATVTGTITHFPNLIPSKTAPYVIGAGQVMTYMLQVYNSGLSTDKSVLPTGTDRYSAMPARLWCRVNDGGTAAGSVGLLGPAQHEPRRPGVPVLRRSGGSGPGERYADRQP